MAKAMRNFKELMLIGIQEQGAALNERRPFNPIYVTREEFDLVDRNLHFSGIHALLPTLCGVPLIRRDNG